MSVRTYGQHCGLAAAMDLVGQRWSMLIVRELTPGPRRFTDLNAALPGVATDVLAERLRELVAAGVVEHRALRHPVPAKVYALTASGLALADVGLRLADWGRSLLPAAPVEGTMVRARWALQTMAFGYRGGLADGDYEVVVDGEEMTLRLAGASATVHYGPVASGAVARLSCSTAQFFTAVRDPAWLRRPHRGVVVDGDVDLLVAVLAALPLRVGDAAAGVR